MSNVSKRGIKRKRGQENDEMTLVRPSLGPVRPTISPEAKFKSNTNDRSIYKHHDIKEVKKAAKIAKTREVQRTVKRLKELRAKNGPNAEIETLERQLDGLKALDHEKLACGMLLRRLNKDKAIRSNDGARKAFEDELNALETPSRPPGQDSLSFILESKLFSSKILAKEVGDT
ncbi:hypothetical protein FRC17_002422, partial [Serendipita sp. 399]